MPLPQYVYRRGNRLYYRRAYPKELWPKTGSAPFMVSLHTESISEATRSRPEAERRYFEAVDKARATIAAATSGHPLSIAAAESLAAERFRAALAEPDLMASPTTPESSGEALERLSDEIADAKRTLAEDGWALVHEARRVASEAGFSSNPPAEQHLGNLLGRSRVAMAQVRRCRAVGDYGGRPDDPFFAALVREPSAPPVLEASRPARTLADLIAAFKADRWDKLAPATHRAQETAFRAAASILGADTELAQVDREAGRKLFADVQRLPRNMGKVKRLVGLSPADAILAGDRLGLPRIAPKTVNDGYLGHLKALFAWGVREQWLAANPLSGLTVADPVADADRRSPFGRALLSLFAGAPWTPATPDQDPALYYGPLLGLFMGLRLGEVASLEIASIGEDRGSPLLTIKSGKTASARRTLVIHPELVRLGFVDMVAARREEGAGLVFEADGPDTKGNWGRKLARRFQAQVAKCGLGGLGLTFHSLRHDFEDALREAGLHGTPLGTYLAGRSQTSKVEAAYGSGYSTAAKASAIQMIEYPALTLIAR